MVRSTPSERSSVLRFGILAAMLAVCALTGGSNRATMVHLLVLRPVLIAGIAALLLVPGRLDWATLRPLPLLLAIFAATIVVQLVPLPPGLWEALPGHARFVEINALLGRPWRPISLVPDLTLNALFALLPALAVLAAFAGMLPRERLRVVWLVLIIVVVGAVLEVVQIAGGPGSIAFFYGQGSDIVPTGLLANRNHHAVLLAATLPLLAVALRERPVRRHLWSIGLIAIGLMIVPLILLTGSRQGIILSVAGLIAALAMLPLPSVDQADKPNRQRLIVIAAIAVPVLLGIVVALSGRAVSLQRFIGSSDIASDMRWRAMPTMLTMLRDFLPFGFGHGGFDAVFRGYEPDALLHGGYFNRAHNDLLELVMAGGVIALVPLVWFLIWNGKRVLSVVRTRPSRRAGSWSMLPRAAAVLIALFLVASLIDYPLRTGLTAMIFTVACCWLATAPAGGADDHAREPRHG